jgi:hypothetical protein
MGTKNRICISDASDFLNKLPDRSECDVLLLQAEVWLDVSVCHPIKIHNLSIKMES